MGNGVSSNDQLCLRTYEWLKPHVQEQVTRQMRGHLNTLKLVDGRGQWAHWRLARLGPFLLPGNLTKHHLSGLSFGTSVVIFHLY